MTTDPSDRKIAIDASIGFLTLITFGVACVISLIWKGIYKRVVLIIDHKLSRRRITIGTIISALVCVPFGHFLVYLTTAEHWAAWYILLAISQGAMWYMTTAPRAWYID